MKVIFPLLVALPLTLADPALALAHKVKVFAYPEGGTIHTESFFSGGRSARDCAINVKNAADQETILSGSSDENGRFAFPAPSPALDLVLELRCSEGHFDTWRIAANEYDEGGGAPRSRPAPRSESEPGASSTPGATMSEEDFRRVLAEELEKKLGPVRRELALSRERGPTARDVAGGIGYILGLAGLAAWCQARRGRK